MPTVSDLISIQLSIDDTGLIRGGEEAIREMDRVKARLTQQANDVERLVGAIGENVNTALRYVAGLMGVVLTFEGFKNLLHQVVESGTSLGRFSESVDIAAGRVGALEQAFERAGARAGDVRPTLAAMRSDIIQAQMGGAPPEWMKTLGLAPFRMGARELMEKSPEDTLLEISRRGKGLPPMALKQFLPGLPLSPETLALLSKPEELQRQLDEIKKAGTAPTQEQIGAAERLKEKFATLEQLSMATFRDLVSLAEPLLNALLDGIKIALSWLDRVERVLIGSGIASPAAAPTYTPAPSTAPPSGGGGRTGGGGMIGSQPGFGGYRPHGGTGGSGGGMGRGGGERFGIEGPDVKWADRMRSGGNLANDRARLVAELNRPEVKDRLMALTGVEVGGQGAEAARAFVETVFNRALARNQSLERTMQTDYYPNLGNTGSLTPADRSRMTAIIDDVVRGSNSTNYATGNASGTVGFAGGPQTAYVRGGRVYQEGSAAPGSAPSGHAAPDQQGRPYYFHGNLQMEGRSYPFGTGGRGRGSIPYGDYPITPGTVGPWGAAHGAIGLNNNSMWDPALRSTRQGIEIHSGSSDADITSGCIAIAGRNWPQFKAHVLDMIHRYGSVTLHVGPDGARVTPTAAVQAGRHVTSIPNVGTGAAAAAMAPQQVHKNVNNESTAVINHVTVHSAGTDAGTIAKDIRDEVGKQLAMPEDLTK